MRTFLAWKTAIESAAITPKNWVVKKPRSNDVHKFHPTPPPPHTHIVRSTHANVSRLIFNHLQRRFYNLQFHIFGAIDIFSLGTTRGANFTLVFRATIGVEIHQDDLYLILNKIYKHFFFVRTNSERVRPRLFVLYFSVLVIS